MRSSPASVALLATVAVLLVAGVWRQQHLAQRDAQIAPVVIEREPAAAPANTEAAQPLFPGR